MAALSSRRAFVAGAAAALATPSGPAHADVLVNDASQLNPISVARILTPRYTAEIARAVSGWPGPVSVRGGGYSMGGQIAEEHSLHFDLRGFNRMVALDTGKRIARVQTGMRWRDLQEAIDPHGLSVKIMQSYANFTIGGALSVNAHGRYVGLGPVVNSVRRIWLVLADGRVVEASRDQNSELFYGAIGGYGGLGVIVEAELELVPNTRIERVVEHVTLVDYTAWFSANVVADPLAVMHNGDIDLTDFRSVRAVTWRRTAKPATIAAALSPIGRANLVAREEAALLAEIPGAQYLRRGIFNPLDALNKPVVWRNYEASLDLSSLPPLSNSRRVYALQEYFIPVARFADFSGAMRQILRASRVNAVNVSIRHASADRGTLMAWSQHEVFSFVLFYQQKISTAARLEVGQWTRQLIQAALTAGGTYYLPYQLHATREQFLRAYPNASHFFALKARVDPHRRFRNKLWDKYGV